MPAVPASWLLVEENAALTARVADLEKTLVYLRRCLNTECRAREAAERSRENAWRLLVPRRREE